MVAVPAPTTVTLPSASTLATPVLLLAKLNAPLDGDDGFVKEKLASPKVFVAPVIDPNVGMA
jgi:hypothetical protein